jgi:hypothetical protein
VRNFEDRIQLNWERKKINSWCLFAGHEDDYIELNEKQKYEPFAFTGFEYQIGENEKAIIDELRIYLKKFFLQNTSISIFYN